MLKDFERWEVLVRGQQRIGVRYQSLASNVLLTRLLIDEGVDSYKAESRIRLDPVTDAWELNWFRDQSMEHAQLMRWEAARFPAVSMPSFGEILMIMKALETPDEKFSYWRLSEVAQDAQNPVFQQPDEPNAWVLKVGEIEDLPIPLGTTLRTQRYEAWADGLLVASYWANENKELVCASWGENLTAFRVPGSPSDAGWLSLSEMEERTVNFMVHGFDE